MPDVKEKPLFPPEETMWQKYSPRFELPLASATSIFLHGLAVGAMMIAGLAYFFNAALEATQPPRIDVVMVEGGGTGFEGLGGEAGLPGPPDGGEPKRTEFVPNSPEQPEFRPTPSVPDEPLPQLGLPLIEDGNPPLSSDLTIELRRIAEDADRQVREQMQLPKAPPSTGIKGSATGPKGTGNPKGVNGLGGSGGGTGMGNKKGSGKGTGPGGRLATDQEAKAWRWRFDMSGDPKEHARKLAAIGVTLAVPDPRGGFILITDLNRRPVEVRQDALLAYKDAVKWYNTKPDSVQSLARELQLPFSPKFVVMLLPKDREANMAKEEARYAQEHRRDVAAVQMTLFDFRLRNGAYDPMVVEQK